MARSPGWLLLTKKPGVVELLAPSKDSPGFPYSSVLAAVVIVTSSGKRIAHHHQGVGSSGSEVSAYPLGVRTEPVNPVAVSAAAATASAVIVAASLSVR